MTRRHTRSPGSAGKRFITCNCRRASRFSRKPIAYLRRKKALTKGFAIPRAKESPASRNPGKQVPWRSRKSQELNDAKQAFLFIRCPRSGTSGLRSRVRSDLWHEGLCAGRLETGRIAEGSLTTEAV